MPVPDFVARLRSHIGHDLLWLPGVTGVVLDDDRVLLGRRADNGLWALVSGILEPGEEPAAGLVREVAEETGVHAAVDALTAVSASHRVTYPNGDVSQYLDLTFLCHYVAGDARVADDESTDVAWFSLDAVPRDITPTSRERLARTLAYRADPSRGAHFAR